MNRSLTLAIVLSPALIYAWGGSQPTLLTNADIKTTDNSVVQVNDLRINGNTEVILYVKPATTAAPIEHTPKKDKTVLEVPLENDPHDTKVGPFALSAIRTARTVNPDTEYTYQETDTSAKQIYLEIMVDNKSYLIPKMTSLSGIDIASGKKVTFLLHIIDSITVTSTRQKDTSPAATGECICPTK